MKKLWGTVENMESKVYFLKLQENVVAFSFYILPKDS